MFNVLTRRGVIAAAIAVVLVTALMAWLTVAYEPPAFFGYVFGAFSGALLMSLFILIRDYAEGN